MHRICTVSYTLATYNNGITVKSSVTYVEVLPLQNYELLELELKRQNSLRNRRWLDWQMWQTCGLKRLQCCITVCDSNWYIRWVLCSWCGVDIVRHTAVLTETLTTACLARTTWRAQFGAVQSTEYVTNVLVVPLTTLLLLRRVVDIVSHDHIMSTCRCAVQSTNYNYCNRTGVFA